MTTSFIIFLGSYYHFSTSSPSSRIERVRSVVAMHPTISKVVAKSNKLQKEKGKLIFRHEESNNNEE